MYKIKFENQKATLEAQNNYLIQEKNNNSKILASLQQEKERISNLLSKKETEIDFLNKKLSENKSEIEKLQEKFTKAFENLAQKILDKNSEKFSKQSNNSLKNFLDPLKLQIENFQKKVEDTNKEDIQRNAALIQKIKSLESLNQQMSQDKMVC